MEKKSGKILLIDDDTDILQAARLFLKQHVAQVRTESNPERVEALLRRRQVRRHLPGYEFQPGRARTARKASPGWAGSWRSIPHAVVILITAYGDVELAVRGIKEGATDFVLKPWQNEKLLATLAAALKLRRSRTEAEGPALAAGEPSSPTSTSPSTISSAAARPCRPSSAAIAEAGLDRANVLILGENGTGKELVARELHRQSRRAEEVFLSVDMGALSETLFESELFGHMKGAFTDARRTAGPAASRSPRAERSSWTRSAIFP